MASDLISLAESPGKLALVARLALAPVWQLRSVAALFFGAALVSRIWLSKHIDAVWSLPVRGLLGDALAAVFLACALALALRVHKAAACAALVLWAALSIANVEHIYALDAPLRLANYALAFSEDFIRGSALNIVSWPAAAAAAGAAALLMWRLPKRLAAAPPGIAAIFLLVLASGHLVWRQALQSNGWRQTSPLAAMLVETSRGTAGATGASGASGAAVEGAAIQAFFASEGANGTRAGLALRVPARNVLLLVLEGLPGVYLEQVRRASGVRAPISMPKLSRIAERALVVPDFVSHAHGTISGLYSVFCADYSLPGDETLKPYLLLTMAREDRPRCLPQLLADAGYRTVFLQSASLKYMKKGQIMPRIGFAEVTGKDNAAKRRDGNFWGGNDGSLLERTLGKIELLRTSGQPWFLSMLTVGTHHPFIAPPQYRQKYGDAKTAAVRFLDDRLAEFMAALEERGVMRDTLVLIVSDESHGVPGQPFGAHWGMALALGPGVRPSLAEGVFGQVDIAASVLDYLGFDKIGEGLLGRSIFRRYEQKRRILFGNFALFGDFVLDCRTNGCRRHALQGGPLFAPEYFVTGSAGGEREADVYRSAFARAAFLHGSKARNLLYSAPETSWYEVGRDQLSANFLLPAKSRIEVLLDIENAAEAEAASIVMYLLDNADVSKRADDGLPRVQFPPLPPDARLSLHYSFANLRQQDVRLLFAATGRGDRPLNVKINSLRLLATPTDIDREVLAVDKYELNFPRSLGRRNGASVFASSAEPFGDYKYAQAFPSISRGGTYFIAPLYSPGTPVEFFDTDDWTSQLFLAGDWSYPDKWGVWSDGARPAIAFKLGHVRANDDYELKIKLLPHVSDPIITEREISLSFNGNFLENFIFHEQKVEELRIAVPAEMLVEEGINTIEFDVKQPFVPYTYNVSQDFTRLGLGLISFQLSPAGENATGPAPR